jgi:alkylated DNA repair dioxygenase AlkB
VALSGQGPSTLHTFHTLHTRPVSTHPSTPPRPNQRQGATNLFGPLFEHDVRVFDQADLFEGGPRAPEGFRYEPKLIGKDDERTLLLRVRELPFKEFEFHGYTGKRRVVSFGWKYDFTHQTLQQSDDLPDFLASLREVAAAFAGVQPHTLQQVLVTEYDSGAGIGWHRDKAVFGAVIGISLLSACTFRLRRKAGSTWERFSITADPRSAYLLRGPARTEWEHSIPPVDALRYSITFRNFRDEALASK